MKNRKTNEEFLEELKQKHPTLTLLGKYQNGRTKVSIKCNVCSYEFMVSPGSLYMGHGCPKCAGVKRKTHDEFVNEVAIKNPTNEILSEYKNQKIKVLSKCRICGYERYIFPQSLLRGKSCPVCYGNIQKTTDTYKKELKQVNPNIEVIGEYINNRTKIKCKCLLCNNEFMGDPKNMLYSNYGCPFCSMSTGEMEIQRWLKENQIEFIYQYSFDDCRDSNPLPFDFYLPNDNIAIEFDGIQHYKAIEYWGGEKAFALRQKHDGIKNVFCHTHNVGLIRIPYFEFDNIPNILMAKLIS